MIKYYIEEKIIDLENMCEPAQIRLHGKKGVEGFDEEVYRDDFAVAHGWDRYQDAVKGISRLQKMDDEIVKLSGHKRFSHSYLVEYMVVNE